MSGKARATAIVIAYGLAILVASALVFVYRMAMPASDASAGMFAFSDVVLWLAAFTLFSIPGTAIALWSLRGNRIVWIVLTTIALLFSAIATIAIGSAVLSSLGITALAKVSIYAVPAAFLAPLAAIFTGLSAIAAPDRRIRVLLALSALADLAAVAAFAVRLFAMR